MWQDDAAEEQGDHAAPEGHMDAKLFAHDGQEEGASARAETADGNGQAYAGAAQFRWEQLPRDRKIQGRWRPRAPGQRR